MPSAIVTIGVDPGPHTGICVLDGVQGVALECDDASALLIVKMLIKGFAGPHRPVRIAVERFVIGPGTRKAGKAGEITRRVIGEIHTLARQPGVAVIERPAVTVKDWATNRRLGAMGLLQITVGSDHARDACRHAAYSRKWDDGMPDPLLGEQ